MASIIIYVDCDTILTCYPTDHIFICTALPEIDGCMWFVLLCSPQKYLPAELRFSNATLPCYDDNFIFFKKIPSLLQLRSTAKECERMG